MFVNSCPIPSNENTTTANTNTRNENECCRKYFHFIICMIIPTFNPNYPSYNLNICKEKLTKTLIPPNDFYLSLSLSVLGGFLRDTYLGWRWEINQFFLSVCATCVCIYL